MIDLALEKAKVQINEEVFPAIIIVDSRNITGSWSNNLRG
jgi:hypothetical protein